MLQLTTKDIQLAQAQSNKLDAIRSIAADLANKGLVDQGYVEGMLNREAQKLNVSGQRYCHSSRHH